MRPERPRVHAIPPSTDGSGAPHRPRTSSRIQPWSRSMSVARCAGSGGWLTSPSVSWRPPRASACRRSPTPKQAPCALSRRARHCGRRGRSPPGAPRRAGPRGQPMSADAVRDMAGRRFPAHLDTRYSGDRVASVRTARTGANPGTRSTGTAGCGTCTGAGTARRTTTRFPSRATPPPTERSRAAASTGGGGRRSGSDGSSPASSRRSTQVSVLVPPGLRRARRLVGQAGPRRGCPCLCDLG